MNDNLAKIIAIAIIGGVAKALFRQPDTHNTFNYEAPKEESKEIEVQI